MRRCWLGLGGLLVALTACGGSGQKTAVLPPAPTAVPTLAVSSVVVPTIPAPMATSASPTISPTAVAVPTGSTSVLTPLPAVTATALTADDAYALARRVYDAANIAFATGNTEPYLRAVATNCVCRNGLITFVRDKRAKSERVIGGSYQQVRTTDFHQFGSSAKVSVFYLVAKGEILDASGHVVDSFPAHAVSQDDVTLELGKSGWYVADIGNLTRGKSLS